MVAGHLQEKKGLFYIVLNYKDENDMRKSKWISTGLAVKGNKKRAHDMLREVQQNFVVPVVHKSEQNTSADEVKSAKAIRMQQDMLFADYLQIWLRIAEHTVSVTTFASYESIMRRVIEPYFRELGVTLKAVTALHIQNLYLKELERVKATTVIHYHAIVHRALKYAVSIDLLAANPADKVERPKKERFAAGFYDSDEVKMLYERARGNMLEIPVVLASFYGLRRSEVIGLKWSAIDFQRNTITISHTVTSCNLRGKHMEVAQDTTKTKSSLRTLPLVPSVRDMLMRARDRQTENRRLCGRSYCTEYAEYICVNEIGERIKPSYLSSVFSKFLKQEGLRPIRFHDLRHSCASLMLANGVPMKQIQEWLGHSDFSTTANIYAHLESQSKLNSADALANGLGLDAGYLHETANEKPA